MQDNQAVKSIMLRVQFWFHCVYVMFAQFRSYHVEIVIG